MPCLVWRTEGGTIPIADRSPAEPWQVAWRPLPPRIRRLPHHTLEAIASGTNPKGTRFLGKRLRYSLAHAECRALVTALLCTGEDVHLM